MQYFKNLQSMFLYEQLLESLRTLNIALKIGVRLGKCLKIKIQIRTCMCDNDELSSTMNWVGCLLTDSGLPDMYMRVGNNSRSFEKDLAVSVNKTKSSWSGSKQP